MGASEVENERLLGLDPESMRLPPDDEEANTPAWRRRLRRRVPTWINWKTTLFAAIILIVSVSLLTNSFRTVKEDTNKTIRPVESQPIEQQPVTEQPQESEAPAMSQPFQLCEGTPHQFEDQVMALNFDSDKSVSFFEEQHEHPGEYPVLVEGQVEVRRLDGGEPRMVLKTATNDPDMLLSIFQDDAEQRMKVSIPKKYSSSVGRQTPCVEMRATIWVPENANLRVLSINVTHFGIGLLDDLSLNVKDHTALISTTGSIGAGVGTPASNAGQGIGSSVSEYTYVPAKDSYVFNSTAVEARTVSGQISGNWPLYEILGLHTTAGSIKVDVTPKERLQPGPGVAVLSLSTTSGDISVVEPIHSAPVPLLDYLVDIKSTSGSIHGAVAFGPAIKLQSVANDIVFDLLPVMHRSRLTPQTPAQLETVSRSGVTVARILDPIWYGGSSDTASTTRLFDCLEAKHQETSGDMKLQYPKTWKGNAEVKSTSGRVSIAGNEVFLVSQANKMLGADTRVCKGPKGYGEKDEPGSKILAVGTSGDMYLTIGEE
ncbi:hypothetical protein F4775DRAFT_342248 [Biscogniauxia sp. FL1348]|nr:hypothetical protein F4775DRAFT_342248 [Biscogniauxia sp. FL1348]